ncbi:uncharacterized protein LOC143195215 [Rhynchophorus ferrugineus]|uniref:uncharacterized protein LOC143195215 n=1 Tax=Rhynchophorus ferrugineus TaxID=354439 RepID=UPI003FCECDE2
MLLHQDNAPCYKSVKTMAKIHELGFELLPHPPYSPDLAPIDHFMFSDLKRMLAGKKFSSNEVIAESEAYLEAKDSIISESPLKGIMLNKKTYFVEKFCFRMVQLTCHMRSLRLISGRNMYITRYVLAPCSLKCFWLLKSGEFGYGMTHS